MFESIYTAEVTVSEGRNGDAISDDGKLKAQLAMPDALGGPTDRQGTNPEQLFGACFGACLGSTLQAIAKMNEIEVNDLKLISRVILGRLDQNGFQLKLNITIGASAPDKEALALLAKDSFEVCPYAKAIKGNVEIAWEIDDL